MFDFFLWGVLWQNMQLIPEKINRGTLDLELIKPINQQFLLSFRLIGFDDFHSLIVGIHHFLCFTHRRYSSISIRFIVIHASYNYCLYLRIFRVVYYHLLGLLV